MSTVLESVPPPSPMTITATAELPSEFGTFRIVGFDNHVDGREHIALVCGDIEDGDDVLVRLHSECLTGDVLGSQRCDCRAQLHAGLEAIAEEGRGVLLYLRQEGRGIGLVNKIRAYELQDGGLDTVEANHALGFADDLRDYRAAAAMLNELGIESVKVLTNNPRKVAGLEKHGVHVTSRVEHEMTPSVHNEHYLRTKRERSGHLLTLVS